ncbi:MAG: glycoside hydrolase family 3 N-terminal domain-containing protein [Anaerolineae bacterium]
MKIGRLLTFLLLAALLLGAIAPLSIVGAQGGTPPAVREVFNSMSPEERVGQLFLVTFKGTDVSAGSQIYNLIAQYHVGGVVLLASNDNFVAAPNTLTEAHRLIQDLQRVAWDATTTTVDPRSGKEVRNVYVPLFVALSQEGDGYPSDQILDGLTPLPSEMAIGATWDPLLAKEVGQVLGRELSTLGVNLYLGPSLDVNDTPNPSAAGDMGARIFGGDPYWVGEMGRAYIAGLHNGSNGRLAVIARHFPGRGSSDRSPEEEISTVRKSLEQLKQIELAPFFAVTGNAPSAEAMADGLLVSHIRYQGFQGNIRATTRPVSFDPQALSLILKLPQFVAWREKGGLMLSDDLSTRAVYDFYTQGGQIFSARTVARDAFLAGNDLLYLGKIVSNQLTDPYITVTGILDFFAQKYREDPAFAQRVDAAVLRILNVKYRLYHDFTLASVLTPADRLGHLGQASDVTFNVARRAATLISPNLADLANVLPSPPEVRQRLVFLTDTVSVAQCSDCPLQPLLTKDALQNAIIRLYGTENNNQINPFRLSSYSFSDLQQWLDGANIENIAGDLQHADWVVLLLADAKHGQPALIRRFLTDRRELLRDKRLILFSLTAPYYLDATDISKLSAFYALYSKQPPFIDVAARLLFQELTPLGNSPVSISNMGYDLIKVTAPDPDQIIPLFLDLPPVATPSSAFTTPQPTPIPLFKIGDTIAVRTGVIQDHNGHPVPDGTVVRFSMVLTGQGGGILQQVETVTTQGVARASFGLDKPGLLEIQAASEPANVSEVLRLDVSGGGPVAVTVIVPAHTETVLPTPQVTPPPSEDGFVTPEGYPRLRAWLLTMVALLGGAWLVYWVGISISDLRAGVRWGLCTALGGLLAYNYLALGLPGSQAWTRHNGVWGILLLTILGEGLGWGVGWLWSQRINGSMSLSG